MRIHHCSNKINHLSDHSYPVPRFVPFTGPATPTGVLAGVALAGVGMDCHHVPACTDTEVVNVRGAFFRSS